MNDTQELLDSPKGRLLGSSTKLSITSGDLLDLLTGAEIATFTDKSLPVLTGINLVSDGEYLTATATDRYRLISGKVKSTGSPFTALVQNIDALKVIAALKPIVKRRDPRPISLEIGTNEILFNLPDQSFTFRLIDGTFPKYEELINKESASVGQMAFNCSFLGDFAKVPTGERKGSIPVRFTFHGEGKIVTATVSHPSIEWKLAIMPMKYAN